MIARPLLSTETVGLVKPASDAHTLGLLSVAALLTACGVRVIVAGPEIAVAVETLDSPTARDGLVAWLRDHRITRLGLSYRLDPCQGVAVMGGLRQALADRRLLAAQGQGGALLGLYFAGLPETCRRVDAAFCGEVTTFDGDETDAEALHKLGVPPQRIPASVAVPNGYDELRLRFGARLVAAEAHRAELPPDRSGYAAFGTPRDTLEARLQHSQARGLTPLTRVHAGPYNRNRLEALRQFNDWARQLAASGWLDVLSIGSSQLTQSRFGENWGDAPNGGGVPINTPDEYRSVWAAARPMLVRTYAGTRDVPSLARMHEESLNIAWHALSFWWFSQLDGRGPNDLQTNLREHLEALRYIAGTGKPFEPNVAHHFAFRGADDVACVLSTALAARAAKRHGIRHLVLQLMLNTPRRTWGIQDLAKARATLRLVRELEDASFRVTLQPRAGLDCFSVDPTRARAQLAAVTALMDDIEPSRPDSPPLVHVVSYSEATHLATPDVIIESLQITQAALRRYRALRRAGEVPDMAADVETEVRTVALYEQAAQLLRAIEAHVAEPYTAEGLYRVFAAGFLPVPQLWACRQQFPAAVGGTTALLDGGVVLTDSSGRPVQAAERLQACLETLGLLAGLNPCAQTGAIA